MPNRRLFRCESCGATVLTDVVEKFPVCQGRVKVGDAYVDVHGTEEMVVAGKVPDG